MHFDYANLCIESGLFDQALHEFKCSKEVKPSYIDAYLTMSQFLSTLNRD